MLHFKPCINLGRNLGLIGSRSSIFLNNWSTQKSWVQNEKWILILLRCPVKKAEKESNVEQPIFCDSHNPSIEVPSASPPPLFTSLIISLWLCMSLSIYVWLSLSMYVWISLSIYLSIYLCLSLSIYVCLSLSIYECMSLSLCVSLSIYVSLSLSLSLSLSIWLSHSTYASPSMFVSRYLRLILHFICSHCFVCLNTLGTIDLKLVSSLTRYLCLSVHLSSAYESPFRLQIYFDLQWMVALQKVRKYSNYSQCTLAHCVFTADWI